jgi:uncharacterized repeat protein (TIGR04138 family)
MNYVAQEDGVLRSIADKHHKLYAAVKLIACTSDYCEARRTLETDDASDPLPEVMHVDAVDFCQAVEDYEFDLFGKDAADILAQWGICSSEDVGVIVYELVRVGYIMVSDSDRPEDFHGLPLF